MRRLPAWSLLLSVLLVTPLSARAGVLWRGDFETGDLSQWTRAQQVHRDRLQPVRDPVREGRWALRVTVRQGDDPIGASGNRSELVYLGREREGDERVYRWSTLFPAGYPSAPRWQLFAQWHHTGSSGSPPVELYVVGEEVRLRVGGERGQVLWRTPLRRGGWQDFALRVRWSSDPRKGFVELTHDGRRVLPLTPVATLYPGQGVYFKLGLYRDASISKEGVLYHDGVVVSTGEAAEAPVASAPRRPAPAPAPADPPAPPRKADPPPADRESGAEAVRRVVLRELERLVRRGG